jgi:dTDP-4-amino-4,6-dideoxy-D-galactose acyltransferase
MTSPQRWEILEWDSGVFGFPVARLQATEDRSAMTAAIANAKGAGVRLMYLLTESGDIAAAAGAMGGTLISERVTFVRAVTVPDTEAIAPMDRSVVVEPWTGTSVTPELLHLARDAGRYSRFRVDSRIPGEVFERIYDAWITNSVNGQIAEVVMVTRDASSLLGLVTVGVKDGRGDIGLLAVHEKARGRGLGRALVRASLDWAMRRQLHEAQVVTQRANVAACRLYESCGYFLDRGEHVIHFWL